MCCLHMTLYIAWFCTSDGNNQEENRRVPLLKLSIPPASSMEDDEANS